MQPDIRKEPFEGLAQSAAPGHARPPACEIDIRFDAGPAAAAAARAALSALERTVDPELMEDLRLLVSELVTNSIRHADTGSIGLRVTVDGGTVRGEVVDGGRGFVPAPQAPSSTRIGGWGLYLVDRLSSRWGVARDGLTRVWFELDPRTHGGGGAPMGFAF